MRTVVRDDHPRHRRARKLERKTAKRAPYDRVLIVTEGEKTEVNYFNEIRQHLRLPSAVVRVCRADGTSPLQVVRYASDYCEKTLEWERVFCVIDRDDHAHYDDALALAEQLDGHHQNNEKQPIAFRAIPSNPCFELWLLLHFQRSEAHIHRNEVIRLLGEHMHGYRKGRSGTFAMTYPQFENARGNAERLRERCERPGTNPSTDVDILVKFLQTLRDGR